MTASESHSPAPPSPDGTSVTVDQPLGFVHGVVLRDGRRDPRSGGGSTQPVPVGADPVTARAGTGTGEPATRTINADDGSFEFQLPPGSYLLTEEITGASTEVSVTSQLTSSVTLIVPGA